MSSQTGQSLEVQYPAVNRAYDFVMPSYQMLMTRFEAADNRLTALLTLASSFTAGLPVLMKAVNPTTTNFDSNWFRVGVAAFVALVVVGIAGRVRGTIILPNPRVLYYRQLTDSEWTFKKNAIYFAGKHFDENAATIRAKGIYAAVITLLFAVEALALLVWMAAQ